jgi:hypothetical protein
MVARAIAAHDLEERGTTIVLVGGFNPQIFQPMWFESHGLLSSSDVDAKSLILTEGFVSFQTDIVGITCAPDRCQFVAGPNAPSPDVLRDLVASTFRLLPETPVKEFGVNHTAHLPASVQRWDFVMARFGDPQTAFPLLEAQTLRTIELRGERTDGRNGHRTVQLQPSVIHEGGIWFALNDHVTVHAGRTAPSSIGAATAIEALEGMWASSDDLLNSVIAKLAPGT